MKRLLTFLLTFVLAIGVGWAASFTFTLTGTTSGTLSSDTPAGVSYTLSGVGANNGGGYGPSGSATMTLTIHNMPSTATLKGITMNFKTNTNAGRTYTIAATMNSVSIGSSVFDSSNTSSSFEDKTLSITETAFSGDLVITVHRTSSGGAIYFKTFTFEYETSSTPTVENPVFNPAGDTYYSAQNVTITSGTTGADIYYTMGANPADPDANSTPYTDPIPVSSTTTIKAIAIKDGNSSQVVSATYTIASVPTPTIAPASGASVLAGSEVTITAGEGCNIYYTMGANPTDPTNADTQYDPSDKPSITGAANSTVTVKAIAYAGNVAGTVATATYTIATPTAPTFSEATGTIGSGTPVTITAQEGMTIRYTLDGTDPTASTGNVYSAPVAITGTAGNTVTLKAIAVDASNNVSTVTSATYTIAAVSQLLDVLTHSTFGVTSTSYTPWTGKSKANNNSGIVSDAVYAGKSAYQSTYGSIQLNYNTSTKPGIVSTTSGGKVKKVIVDWNANTTSNRTLLIYGKNTAYTSAEDLYSDNSYGELLGSLYFDEPTEGTTTELTISGNYDYIGIRSKSGAIQLNEIDILWESTSASATVNPVFTPSAGAVAYGTEVSISTTTENATIYYTTDGNNPTTSSSVYSSSTPIVITGATTLKAFAVATGLTDSEVVTASYTVAAPEPPTFSPAAGPVAAGTQVTISAASGTTIHYTTNGDTPDAQSPTFSTPITINEAMTIKAIAVDGGGNASTVAEAAYTIAAVITFEKITSTTALEDGLRYVVVREHATSPKSMSATPNTKAAVDITIANGEVVLPEGQTTVAVFTLAEATGEHQGKYTFTYPDGHTHLSIGNSSEGIGNSSSATEYMTVTFDDGRAKIVGGGGRWIQYYHGANNGSNEFRTYTGWQASTSDPVFLYKEKLPQVDTPVITLGANSVEAGGSTTATITCATVGATIYYTTDGSVPTTESEVYNGEIALNGLVAATTVSAIAVASGMSPSEIASETVTVTHPNLYIFVDNNGVWDLSQATAQLTYDETNHVYTLTHTFAGNSTRTYENHDRYCDFFMFGTGTANDWGTFNSQYRITTNNGSDYWVVYADLMALNNNGEMGLARSDNGAFNINQGTYNLTVDLVNMKLTVTEIVAAPTISPAGDTYHTATNVTLATTQRNGRIYYTLNGNTPTTSDAFWQGTPITLPMNFNNDVKALTMSENGVLSQVVTEHFVIKERDDNEFRLVTSTSQLKAGYKYVIVSRTDRDALSGSGYFVNNNYENDRRAAASVTLSNDNNTVVISDPTCVLTLGGSTDAWTFFAQDCYTSNIDETVIKDGYLGVDTSNGNRNLELHDTADEYAQASITIDEDGYAVITFNQETGTHNNGAPYSIMHNNGQASYAMYGGTQHKVHLYGQLYTTLADITSTGTVGGEYVIYDDIQVVAKVENGNSMAIVAKDLGNAVNKDVIPAGAIDYNGTVSDFGGTAWNNYDQSNWVLLNIDNANSYTDGTILKGGSVTATVASTGNLEMNVSSTPTTEAGTLPTLNIYNPANFNGPTQVGTSGNTYFFVTPKSYEIAEIKWAYYNGTGFEAIPSNGVVNQGGFTGSFSVDWTLLGGKPSDVEEGGIYNIDKVLILKTSSGSGAPRRAAGDAYTVKPLVMENTNPVTGIVDLNASKRLDSVRYYNLAGMESDKPFNGVNIVVTRFTDGTTLTTKVVR